MASLKRPVSCDRCQSIQLNHLFHPERWVCNACGNIVAERPQRTSKHTCRTCGAPRGSKPFKNGKNQCQECFNKYMVEWRKANPEQYKAWRLKHKRELQTAVRKAVQRSPEAFIRHLFGHIKSRTKHESGKSLVSKGKLNPACLDVQVTFDDLWRLWESQGGKCALSWMPMTHIFHDLCAVSIDRIDSSLGYVPGNIQLVCQWVNRAKNNHSNREFSRLLDRFIEISTKDGVEYLLGLAGDRADIR